MRCAVQESLGTGIVVIQVIQQQQLCGAAAPAACIECAVCDLHGSRCNCVLES